MSRAVPPPRVESEQLAEGVWRLAGGSHHSLLVEFVGTDVATLPPVPRVPPSR